MADLSEGWKDRPPVQWMVSAYLGIGAKDSQRSMPSEEECTAFMDTMAAKAARALP